MTNQSSPGTAQVRHIVGATVVDYGTTWFRINPDGSIIRKDASTAGVKQRPATAAECRKVSAALEASRDRE